VQFDMTELRALQQAHLLSLVPDPESDLLIANYLPAAQYGKEWDNHPVLLDCRGTIIRPDGTVYAKPFRKFFNIGERPESSLEALSGRCAPEVAHKLDGSMITLFHDPNTKAVRFATRGSFTSDQAKHAARIWAESFGDGSLDALVPGHTLLFELVAPYDRIVVAYEREELVLIGVVETDTGIERSYREVHSVGYALGLRSAPGEVLDWRTISEMVRPNFEGFVLFWPEDGLRVKAKLTDYMRLHRIITGLNEHTIWQQLTTDGVSIDDLRREIPEELHGWFDEVWMRMAREFGWKSITVREITNAIRRMGLDPSDRGQRKDIAAYILAHAPKELHGSCFAHLDGKDWAAPIWRLLEPRGSQVTTTPVAARAEAS